MKNIQFSTLIMTRQPLCIDNQYHNIMQSSAIKVLLRHLGRRYTPKCINNHANSTNGNKTFFLKNSFTCLSYLLTLVLKGCARTNHLDNLLCRDIVVCILRDSNKSVGCCLNPICDS